MCEEENWIKWFVENAENIKCIRAYTENSERPFYQQENHAIRGLISEPDEIAKQIKEIKKHALRLG